MSAPLLLHRDEENTPLFSRSSPTGTSLVGWGWTKAGELDGLILVVSPLERGVDEAGAGIGAAVVPALVAAEAVLKAVAGMPFLAEIIDMLSVWGDSTCGVPFPCLVCVGAGCCCLCCDGG